jgi:hypothetical protein
VKSSQGAQPSVPPSSELSSNYGGGAEEEPDADSEDSQFVSAPGDGHLYLSGDLFDFRAFK